MSTRTTAPFTDIVRSLPHDFILVGFGGAAGAATRWGVGRLVPTDPGTWPWPTLIVNVVGSLLIGFAVRHVDRASRPWSLLVTGGLGGFTTMSTVAVELNDLVDAGRTGLALTYAGVTLVVGYLAVTIGAGATPITEQVVEDAT